MGDVTLIEGCTGAGKTALATLWAEDRYKLDATVWTNYDVDFRHRRWDQEPFVTSGSDYVVVDVLEAVPAHAERFARLSRSRREVDVVLTSQWPLSYTLESIRDIITVRAIVTRSGQDIHVQCWRRLRDEDVKNIARVFGRCRPIERTAGGV